MTAPMRMTPPTEPLHPGSRASVLHRELAELRTMRDDDPRRFLNRVQALRESDAVQLVALALITERWSPEQRAAVIARPDPDDDPRDTPAFQKFLADDRRHNKGAA